MEAKLLGMNRLKTFPRKIIIFAFGNFILLIGCFLWGWGAGQQKMAFAQEIKTPPTVFLEPGASKIITIKETGTIKVSRRGIIHMEPAGENSWLVTAISSGLVAIKILDQGKTHLVLLIKVEKNREAKLRTLPRQYSRERLPEITSAPREIKTITELLQLFTQCQKYTSRCGLQVTLSQSLRLTWREYLSRTIPKDFTIKHFGDSTFITAYCPPYTEKQLFAEIELILPGAIKSSFITVACHARARFNYWAKGKFILHEKSHQEKQGINFFGQSEKSEILSENATIAAHVLDYRQTLSKAEAVTEPAIIVSSGNEAFLESGGELLLSAIDPQQNDKKLNVWKNYGVSMTLKVLEVSEEKLELSYKIQIKNPDFSSGNQNLTGSEVKNSIFVKLGQPIYLGELNFSTHHQLNTRQSLLAGIPIIGPIFKMDSDNSLNMNLSAWLTLEKI